MRYARATGLTLTLTAALNLPLLAQETTPPETGAGGPGQRPGMGPGMGRMGGGMPTFASFDTDGNGALSEDEFAQGRAKRIKERSEQGYQMRNLAEAPAFDAIDRNNDGHIDQQEFEHAQGQHRKMMQP
jgi:hypothetical protein